MKTLVGNGVLVLIVAVGMLFRAVGLGWGIPRPLPPEATALRNSFHLDEDDYLWGVLRMHPHDWNFDVRDYHWGTLQFYLIAGALKTAGALKYLTHPWRDSFLKWDPANFPRIYIAGRAVSALAGVLSLVVVFLLGRTLKDAETGLAAAAFLAVAPLHVVNSHFLTSDVTMVFLLLISLYLLVKSLDSSDLRFRPASGFVLGLAISAKYNAAFLLPLWIGCDFIQRGIPWKARTAAYGALVAGFAAGEPYAFVHGREFAETLYRANFLKTDAARLFLLPWPRLLLAQAQGLTRFGLQWTLAVPALCGLVFCFVRPSKKKMVLPASVGLMAGSLVAARWPLIRYTLPLVPLAAVAAALFVAELRISESWRPWASVLLCSLPLFVSWAQVNVLAGEHPANRASEWIDAHISPGSRIGQIWPEVPPLDSRRYDLRAMQGLFLHDPPGPRDLDRQYVVLDDLPIEPFGGDFLTRLARDYALLAEFRSDVRVGRWVINEQGAPHDWKYTHPVLRIFQRKQIGTGISPPIVAGSNETPPAERVASESPPEGGRRVAPGKRSAARGSSSPAGKALKGRQND